MREAGGDNLKSIAAVRDWPPLRQPLRDFVDWVARWTLAPRGMALRMAIRAHEALEPPAPRFAVVATGKPPARMTEARAKVLAALARPSSGPIGRPKGRPSFDGLRATFPPRGRDGRRRDPSPPGRGKRPKAAG